MMQGGRRLFSYLGTTGGASAASILGMDEETAGVRLIKTAAPDRWRDIVAGYQILNDNRAAIAQCAQSEAKTISKIRCAIEIRSPSSM